MESDAVPKPASNAPRHAGILRRKEPSSAGLIMSNAPEPGALPSGIPDRSLYERLFHGLYDAIIITDLDGRVIDPNNRAEILTQFARFDLLRMNIEGVVPGLTRSLLESIRVQLASGRFMVMEAYCRRRSEGPLPVEIAISRIALTTQGEFCFSLRNITQRRNVQEMLKTEHHALQNSACGMAITDLNGVLQYVNPAFLRIWEHTRAEDVLGRPIESLWAKETVDQYRNSLLTGQTWSGDIHAATHTGAPLHVRATAALNRDQAGRLTGLVLSFVDITELRLAEEAIRREVEGQLRTARQKEEFAGLLNIISLTDIIQLIDSSTKSGILEVQDAQGAVTASIAFDHGQIVQAQARNESGEEAVHEALRLGGDSFRFRHGTLPARDESIKQSTMSILLAGLRLCDEASREQTEPGAGV